LERGEAVAYWQKGIFCIKLVRKETEKREEYPQIAVGIDPGSKREGYTAMTPKGVILNITSNTPYWIKDHMETRRASRKNRRFRKTPYRACRTNRNVLRNTNRIPPSTKARWDAKLRILKLLCKILPITDINVEDICAVSKEGKKKWNISFSPLEVGKNYFYSQIETLYPNIKLIKTKGKQTATHRKSRGFAKSKNKLDYTWDAHNSDSHSLGELALQKNVLPFYGLYQIRFLEFHRRQLHAQTYSKGHIRKRYGSTVSCGYSRGSVVRDVKTLELYVLGGFLKDGIVSINDIYKNKRISTYKKLSTLNILYCSKYATFIIKRI
jgi:hypothetical protein